MAYVTRKVSDLTGVEADEKSFISLIVRQHPAITAPVALDVLPDEIKSMKVADDLVFAEIKGPMGETKEIAVRLADFNKLSADMPKILANARGTRGRKPGSRNGK